MNRGGISQTINEFMQALGVELPPWAGLAFVVIVVILFFPTFVKNARTQRARKIWKSSFFENIDRRQALQEEALALVENNVDGLFSLVELALQASQLQLAERTLARIPNQRKHRREIRRYEFKIEQKALRKN